MNMPFPKPDFARIRRLGAGLAQRAFWTRKRILIAAGGAVVLLLLLPMFSGSKPSTFVTAPAARGALTVTVSATGTLQPEDEVEVGAEISGRVDAVNVDYNARVTKGEVLAVINTDQLKAQLAQAQAALDSAQANVKTSEATLVQTRDKRARYYALLARGAVSKQDMQTADADYQRAVAGLAKAKADAESATAQVANIQTSIDKAVVRSPIDGVVLDRKIQAGQTVAAQFQTPVLFTLASDLSKMQLQVDIDEADIGAVHEGQTATFTVDAFPSRHFNAKLISLHNAPQTENGVVTYQGVLEVDNGEYLLRPGLTATADILVAQVAEALLVPNGALRFTPPDAIAKKAPPLPLARNGEALGRVWVLDGQRLAPRDVKTGRTDGRQTEILSGDLKPGENVITDMTATR